ncbi:hypothetical protein ASD11_13185 [Aeromicrobium sp. Root495]|nr:hypothetical protein ASD11_13185 [Aeromicrobium sp. Root495]
MLKISKAYADGDFTQSPNGIGAPSVLTNGSLDQTLTVKERTKKAKDEKAAAKPNKGGGGSSDGSGGSGTGGSGPGTGGTGGTGGSTGGSDGSGGSTGGDGSTGGSTPPKTVGGGLQSGLDQTPLGTVTKPVTDLLSATEANLRCLITFPLGIPQDKFQKCVYDLTH